MLLALAGCAQADPPPQKAPVYLHKYVMPPKHTEEMRSEKDALMDKLDAVQRDVEWLKRYTTPKNEKVKP